MKGACVLQVVAAEMVKCFLIGTLRLMACSVSLPLCCSAERYALTTIMQGRTLKSVIKAHCDWSALMQSPLCFSGDALATSLPEA